MNELFASDFKSDPFWWEDAPRPEITNEDLPSEVDVLVIGSGYTGLHAALQTAREGLSTLVVDADALGWGCSSRNGGQVSTSVKGTYPELAGKYGAKLGLDLLKEGHNAMDFLDAFIRDENVECAWERKGRFSGAHNEAAYDASAKALQSLPKEVATRWHMVSREEQQQEIASDLYAGGVVYPDHGALHPAQYHLELLHLVQAAGAQTIGHCAVQTIERKDAGFLVTSEKGVVRAGQVVVATNGYTGNVTPWMQRRVIPIGSYIIATEPLSDDVARGLSPHMRVMSDTRKLVFYYRRSPDGRRMLFGGRVALSETDAKVSAPALHAAMCKIYPQLSETKISHSWLGFVAYTFDTLPHVGEQDGLHYAMGYCGSGVSLASYCGHKIGRRVAGLGDAETAFEALKFPTRPLYRGNPWFLEPAVLYYKLRDRMNW